jgi:hypothetical protein
VGGLVNLILASLKGGFISISPFLFKRLAIEMILDVSDENNLYSFYVDDVKYKYPMRDFMAKYKRFFNIPTVFDTMIPAEKENTESLLSKIMNLAGKIEEKFSQLSNFCLLKTNPFFYSEKLPEYVMSNLEEYKSFLNSMNRKNFLRIKLDYFEISKAEGFLSNLLQRICLFHERLSYKPEDVSINELADLKQELRFNIEHLLHLGISLNKQSSELTIVNKLWPASSPIKDELKKPEPRKSVSEISDLNKLSGPTAKWDGLRNIVFENDASR